MTTDELERENAGLKRRVKELEDEIYPLKQAWGYWRDSKKALESRLSACMDALRDFFSFLDQPECADPPFCDDYDKHMKHLRSLLSGASAEQPSVDSVEMGWQREREQQRQDAMPKIAPVLNAWDDLPNDEKGAPELARLGAVIQELDAAMEGEQPPAEQPKSRMSTPRLTERPKIVCLCGSTRFTDQMLVKQWELTKAGNVVLSWCAVPESYLIKGRRHDVLNQERAHIGDQEGVKEIVDEVHLRKIDLSDEVFVLNVDGYIGESTRNEIEYARTHGKPVKYLEPDASLSQKEGEGDTRTDTISRCEGD